MTKYRDLKQAADDWLAEELSKGRTNQTTPAGTIDLGESGEVTWEDAEGVRKNLKDLEAELKEALEEGIATASGKNTVSTSGPPSSAEGYLEGAWWTQIASQSDLTVTALWQVINSEWTPQSIPAGGLVAPYADIGLMSVAVLSAKIITSGFFRTAASGRRWEVDEAGIRAYDSSGALTININGTSNQVAGELIVGSQTQGGTGQGLRIGKDPNYSTRYGVYWVRPSGFSQQPALRVDPTQNLFQVEGGNGARLAFGASGSTILWSNTSNNLNSRDYFRVHIGDSDENSTEDTTTRFFASQSMSYMRTGQTGAQVNVGTLSTDGIPYANMSATNSSATGGRVWVEGERAGIRTSMTSGGHYIQVDERGLVIDGYRWTRETVTSTATYPTLSDFPNGRFNIQIPYPGHGGLPTPNWGLLDVERVPAAGGGTNYFATYRDDLATGYWTRTYVNGTWTPWRNLSGASGIAWSVTVPAGWVNDTNRQFERSGGNVHINLIVRPNGIAPVGEHWVSTFGSEITALGAGKPRTVGSWISIGNNPRGGQCVLDFSSGRVYIHTMHDIPANENLQLTFNFTTNK